MADKRTAASRFLMQATLGADMATIDRVAEQGITGWLDKQLNTPISSKDTYQRETAAIWQHFRQRLEKAHGAAAINGDGNNPALPYKWYFHMAWWQQALSPKNAQHLLRQRVAQALSELLVISDNSSLELDAVGMASYYDLLYRHAFGNYGDLLYEVSMHPCMGVYLSHMNNRKADASQHIHPDENYAREIMQLFSIGLFELNADGTRKQDAKGRDIPTYDNRDIKQLARVFTGLRAHSYQYEWETSFWEAGYNGYEVSFEDGIDKRYKTVPFVDMTRPMQVDEDFHDRGGKRLLKGHLDLPGGRDGAEEIRAVVDGLIAHPNTAPFVAKHLIQQLVTSNPSSDYVRAVAARWGRRGDLKAVIREVLTYPLKHSVDAKGKGGAARSQKLKSPLLRATQLLRAFGAHNDSGRMWVTGESIEKLLNQHPLSAPTVFNFYKPDYTPHGPVEHAGMVAPEFELHTSANAIDYVNAMYYWFFGEFYPEVSTVISSEPGVHNVPEFEPNKLAAQTRDKLRLNFERELKLAADPRRHDELIDHISLLLTGKTDIPLKSEIKKAFALYRDNPLWVVQTVVFMVAISPEFTIQEV